jgi:hypothetical protein
MASSDGLNDDSRKSPVQKCDNCGSEKVKGQEIQDLLKRIIFLESENEFLRKKLEELQQSQTAAPVVNHDVSDKSQLQSIAASLTKVT